MLYKQVSSAALFLPLSDLIMLWNFETFGLNCNLAFFCHLFDSVFCVGVSIFLYNYYLNDAGVHSFNFLGLGYRVDWPISIVLTPGALKMYAEIFSFLIQVKLALFSLTDVWRQLKV